ncbi:hypothetical protein BUALT_Bualt11G0051000 [Buddleja alternifolia]|uniref:Late blight resistance protein homolog R1A-3 n=1 Tax=Buddleja alternifolia TaxID=168488 RepID=A0AAV6WYZ9_9LAMI|nr:hypothetical protein BUALT_Bualt11G0051000 [Buddleja alternifolia]
MAPSAKSLSNILYCMAFDKLPPQLIHGKGKLPWCREHILALFCYLTKLSHLHDIIASNHQHDSDFEYRFETLSPIVPELKKFFNVPKLQYPEKHEIVAAFIDFLIQIIDRKPDWIAPVEYLKIATLHKEMRFLITVLGDTPLRSTELEEVKKLLDRFQDVANIAGNFVYSFFFSRNGVDSGEINRYLNDLLKKIELLKSKIKKHCIKLLKGICTATKTVSVDSLFIVDSLLDDLEDLINGKDELICDVKDQIRTLHEELMFSQSQSYPKNINATEVHELIREAAYEAEYLIKSFVVGDVPVWYLTLRLSGVIKKIKKKYDLGVSEVAKHFNTEALSQARRSPALDDIVVGFEDKETEILHQLVGGVPARLQVITIFGMPGLGKTTLAKKLYNNPSVEYHFHICVWIVVSQTYQIRNLLVDIWSSLSMTDRDTIFNMDNESLAEKIYKTLKGMRYLIVMDDIWDSTPWDDLRRYFPDDGNGSRVLLTSRNKDVGPCNSIIHTLPLLSEHQCWELLQKKVFHNEACPPQLLSIGKQIAANCRGLPLVVVVIAGILSTVDKQVSKWNEVKRSLVSHIFANRDVNCMEILDLSYKHLPDHLKPCFLYFVAFPEDREVSVRRLVPLWIAEGFVRKKEDKSPESVAEEYLVELIDRSLVLVAEYTSAGGVKSCKIHDLLRDLCLRKAREQNFLKFIGKDFPIYERHHRLFVCPNSKRNFPSTRPFGLHVRSFVGHLPYPISLCFQSMKLVRILDLLSMSAKLYGDLDEIGLLIHLRYLAIKDHIPMSIGSLVNLEFLIVESSYSTIITIPSILVRMVKLRYLHVREGARFEKDWVITSQLINNLQSLSSVHIFELNDVEMLRCSPHLRKLKCVCGPPLFPDLRFLLQLDKLKLEFESSLRVEFSEINFPSNIRTTSEINFPVNIKKLTLSKTGLPWEKMSVIGRLPYLEVLKLENDAFDGERWETSDDEFQQLRVLKLESLKVKEWDAWSEHFVKLEQLVLVACYNLVKIPSELGDIPTLRLIEVRWCRKSIKESALQILEEQREMGNEELKVVTRHF